MNSFKSFMTVKNPLFTAFVVLLLSGCDDNCVKDLEETVSPQDITVIAFTQSATPDAAESDFVVKVKLDAPLVIDLCYTHDGVQHEASIQDTQGNKLTAMQAKGTDYNCAVDDIAPVELPAGEFYLHLNHDDESNATTYLGMAFFFFDLNAGGAPVRTYPTSVNDQITDSVTQANVKVVGDAPAIAMGNLYQATAQALSNAAHNATTAQQQTNVTSQAAATMGIATLYSLDTASTGVTTP